MRLNGLTRNFVTDLFYLLKYFYANCVNILLKYESQDRSVLTLNCVDRPLGFTWSGMRIGFEEV